jgi:ubiquinol-cytochrome c reductase cytochrome c subunit
MTLKTIAAVAAFGLLASQAAAQGSGPAATSGNAKAGRQTFVAVGCFECHGYSGQGAETGPRLAPGPMPLAAFRQFVRTPPASMPHYSRKVLSDDEVADIHAYLASIPKPKSSQEIPILRKVPLGPAGSGAGL